MMIKKEYLYKLIDEVPEKRYGDLVKLIKQLTIPEDEPTPDELEAIKKSEEEYKQGQTYSYTIDDLFKEYLGDK